MSCLRDCEHRCLIGGVSCEDVCTDRIAGPDKIQISLDKYRKTKKQCLHDVAIAAKNKMLDLTLDVVQKHKLNLSTGRTY